MIIDILKKIGRWFLVLTHEDRSIDCEEIKNVLVISLASEEHLCRTVQSAKEKFKNSDFKVVLPDSKIKLVSDMIARENALTIKSGASVFEYITHLKEFNMDKMDLIIVLSLNPFLIWEVFRKFKCPKLLYNNAGGWYLIRRKTFYEFLRSIIKSPYEAIYLCIKVCCINIYLLIYALFFSLRRYYYKLSSKPI